MLDKPLAFQINAANNQIRRLLEKSAIQENTANLTGMQYAVLGFLAEQQEKSCDVFQKDIEAEFNIRRSTASTMLIQLEKEGYIERVSIPEDARLKKIVMTAKALEMARIAHQNVKLLQARLTAGISDQEMAQFYQVLKKIKDNADR